MADRNKRKLEIIERQVGRWAKGGDRVAYPLNRGDGLGRHGIWQRKKDYHGQTK